MPCDENYRHNDSHIRAIMQAIHACMFLMCFCCCFNPKTPFQPLAIKTNVTVKVKSKNCFCIDYVDCYQNSSPFMHHTAMNAQETRCHLEILSLPSP